MDNLNVIICAHPADTREASTLGFPLCHLAYRFGREGRLYRSGLGISVRGGMLAVSDEGVSGDTPFDAEVLRDIKTECDARGFDGVVCDFERGASLFTTKFCYEASNFFRGGIKLYVPEAFASAAPSARVMVSSAVTGGSCEEHYRRAVSRYGANRAALIYEPVCIDFIMPAPRGPEDNITSEQLDRLLSNYNTVSYFSRELCANYFTYRDGDGKSHFVMFDDSRSLSRKLTVARQCGLSAAFVAYPDARGNAGEMKV